MGGKASSGGTRPTGDGRRDRAGDAAGDAAVRATPDVCAGPHGTQLIQRAASLLTLLSGGGVDGLRLADLERASGLSQPTVHRILQGLVAAELVAQDPASRRYGLGPLCHELGLAAPVRCPLGKLAAPAVEQVACRTGDTVYLSMRSGADTVCVDRRPGVFRLQTFRRRSGRPLDVGDRRPLGIGAGSMALLAALPDAEVRAVLERNADRYADYRGMDVRVLSAVLDQVRERGYALNNLTLASGIASIGVVVKDDRGVPIGGIGVATSAARIDRSRVAALVDVLNESAEDIRARFAATRRADGSAQR